MDIKTLVFIRDAAVARYRNEKGRFLLEQADARENLERFKRDHPDDTNEGWSAWIQIYQGHIDELEASYAAVREWLASQDVPGL